MLRHAQKPSCCSTNPGTRTYNFASLGSYTLRIQWEMRQFRFLNWFSFHSGLSGISFVQIMFKFKLQAGYLPSVHYTGVHEVLFTQFYSHRSLRQNQKFHIIQRKVSKSHLKQNYWNLDIEHSIFRVFSSICTYDVISLYRFNN